MKPCCRLLLRTAIRWSAVAHLRSCGKQVIEEAVRVFGTAERLLQREAVDSMNYTVSCLKVRCANSAHAQRCVSSVHPQTGLRNIFCSQVLCNLNAFLRSPVYALNSRRAPGAVPLPRM